MSNPINKILHLCDLPPGAGGGGDAIDDFNDFPGSPEDGDTIVYNELYMNWHAASNRWIPHVAYSAGGLFRQKFLDGSEDATARSAAGFTDTTSGAGTISTDGEWISWDTSSVAADNAFLIANIAELGDYGDVDVGGIGFFIVGLFRADTLCTIPTTPTGAQNYISIDGGVGANISLRYSFQRDFDNKIAGFISSSKFSGGYRRLAKLAPWANTDVKHLCLIGELPEDSVNSIGNKNGMALAYVNGILACSTGIQGQGWDSASGNERIVIGDATATGWSAWSFKNFMFSLYGKE